MPDSCEKLTGNECAVDALERRQFFRWEISFRCQLDFGGERQEASISDLSLSGVRLIGELDIQEPPERVTVIATDSGVGKLSGRMVYSVKLDSQSVSGLEFWDHSLSPGRLTEILSNRLASPQLLQRNLSGYFDFLLAREPDLMRWVFEITEMELLSSFEDLNMGKPLRPPEGFDEQVASVAGEDWPIAVSLVAKWAESQREFLSEENLELMTSGLLWGTLLLRLLEAEKRH